MSHSNLVYVAAASALLSGCFAPSFAQDHLDVAARYPNHFKGECSSWIRSHKTGYMYCASPAFDAGGTADEQPAAAGLPELAAADQIADRKHLLERGAVVYESVCQTCHQADGKGLPGAFPPLAGSGAYYGTPENQAGIIIAGLSGKITVQGQEFDGSMPPQGHLTDYDIAAVASYVRTSWGNDDGLVKPTQVQSAR